MIVAHFIVTDPVHFKLGETIYTRLDSDGRIIGLDKVNENTGAVIKPIPGHIIAEPLLDERCRLPITIGGVQLWQGWR